jgi:acetyl esterase/lipase
LEAFDTLTPKDGDVKRLRDHGAYASHARGRFDLYLPPQSAGAPVMIFFYGGSWDSGSKVDYEFAGRALAGLGYVTAIPDYRLVPDVRFPAFLEDCAAATKAILGATTALDAKADSYYLIGHSAGAYNAIMLALDPRYLVAARANPPAGAIGLAGPYDFLPFDVDATINAFANHPDPLETQPINYARKDAPSVLLLHGTDDETVRPRNTQSLAAKLQAAGANVTEKIYAGVNHAEILLAMSRPLRGRAPVLADVKAFVGR